MEDLSEMSIRGEAFWTVAAGRGEIRTEQLRLEETASPSRVEEAVLVRTLFSGVSRGTESLVLHGRIPPGEHERMRAPFQKGAFPFPVKYGYMAVGRVERGPAELVGRVVFCLHPHQDRFLVPAGALTVVPKDVPPLRATLAANMETAINALWDGRLNIGDRIAVVGAGVVGCLIAYLAARIPGCDVTLIDTNPERRKTAAALGVPFGESAEAGTADLVLHASGHPSGLVHALTLAGPEARIVEVSWYGDQPVPLPLGDAFHSQRLELRASQVGTLPPHQASRWTHARRLALALRLLNDGSLDALITSTDPFESIAESLPQRIADPSTLCATFSYR